MIEATTISTKGQLTIPAQIREQLGLEPGTKVRFLVDDDGTIVLFPIKGSIDDAFGILPKPEKALTIEEMDQAIAEGVMERYRRHEGD